VAVLQTVSVAVPSTLPIRLVKGSVPPIMRG
jgi:hypothetical protein